MEEGRLALVDGASRFSFRRLRASATRLPLLPKGEYMKVGSVCSGIGGLELGLGMIADTDLQWVSETDAAASKVLDKHFGVPNLGDLTQIQDPPKVDLVVGGFPCQPVSIAGERKGIEDERFIIADICKLAQKAGAKWLLLENVRGLLTANNGHALARVCAEMAHRGFVRWEWRTLYAAEVGAPHRRDRWFCVATNTNGKGLERPREEYQLEPCVEEKETTWGRYDGAIRRWEAVLGRPAPTPAIDWKMNPAFIEWMMGFPEGWITSSDISFTRTMKCLGNAVVPLQAAYAYADLFRRIND